MNGKPKEEIQNMTKILVVDDEEHIRFLYSEELKEAGYEVASNATGEGMLELINKEEPDIVLLDIKLGEDFNGLDLAQEVRNNFQNLPIIIVTAYDTYQEDIKSVAADFYVIKSHDLTELKNRIKQASEIR
jgi:DNA-binding response OmpR family regulator